MTAPFDEFRSRNRREIRFEDIRKSNGALQNCHRNRTNTVLPIFVPIVHGVLTEAPASFGGTFLERRAIMPRTDLLARFLNPCNRGVCSVCRKLPGTCCCRLARVPQPGTPEPPLRPRERRWRAESIAAGADPRPLSHCSRSAYSHWCQRKPRSVRRDQRTPPDPLEVLAERLDRLAAENRDLRKELDALRAEQPRQAVAPEPEESRHGMPCVSMRNSATRFSIRPPASTAGNASSSITGETEHRPRIGCTCTGRSPR